MAQVVSHRPITHISPGSFLDLCVCVFARARVCVCVCGGGDLWCTKWNREGF